MQGPPSCSAEPPLCTGNRDAPNASPLGIYEASNVQTPFHGKVTQVDLNFPKQSSSTEVTYTQTVKGCLFVLDPPADPPNCLNPPGLLGPPMTFTGNFIDGTDNTGSVLIPVANPTNIMDKAIDNIFGKSIHWCPKQNHFVVKIGSSPAPYCVLTHVDTVYAAVSPSADTSDGCPKKGDPCNPSDLDTCCSTTYPSSGLKCVSTPFKPPAIGSIYTCQ